MFPKQSELVQKAVGVLFGLGETLSDLTVIFIEPDLTHPRLSTQAACFSLHMSNTHPVPDDLVVQAKRSGQTQASTARVAPDDGHSWASLFPDLDHLSREMQASWGFDV